MSEREDSQPLVQPLKGGDLTDLGQLIGLNSEIALCGGGPLI